MLNTINGFDLLLIIIITLLGFKVYNLTKECESYVEQIITMQWKDQANRWGKHSEAQVEAALETYPHTGCVCNYCTDSDPWLTKCEDSF